jgi:hypothetical protein
MDLYNLVMKIPYALMLMVGITLILQTYVGGLNNLSVDIDQYNEDRFRSTVVLENTLSVQEDSNQIRYNYDHRRAVTPVEFFTQEASTTSEIGYMKNGGDCYIPKVAGLDGEDFGFYIRSLDSDMSDDLDCTTRPGDRSETVYSPILLIRKASGEPPLPARLYIYAK